MHPIDNYPTIQRGLEEIRRQAERERLARMARLRKASSLKTLWQSSIRTARHLVRWSQKLRHVRTLTKRLDSVPTSPHH